MVSDNRKAIALQTMLKAKGIELSERHCKLIIELVLRLQNNQNELGLDAFIEFVQMFASNNDEQIKLNTLK